MGAPPLVHVLSGGRGALRGHFKSGFAAAELRFGYHTRVADVPILGELWRAYRLFGTLTFGVLIVPRGFE